jgi:hypothetical protein
MNSSKDSTSISKANRKTSGLTEVVRLVELVVSIALAITPLSLTAFASISGA